MSTGGISVLAEPATNLKAQQADQRKEAILRVVDEFIEAYDAWVNDAKTVMIDPDGPLGDRIEIMLTVCGIGAVPEKCLDLVLAVNRLGLEWRRYNEGSFVAGTLEPQSPFYAAVRAVSEARRGVKLPTARLVESVRTLREQKVSDIQIAKIYGFRNGDLWTGPFFNARGAVMSHLIDKECEQPGSVITADWQHPADAAAAAQRERDMQTRLERVDQRASQSVERRREGTRPTDQQIADYLAEGAFLHQVLRQWPMLTGKEVLAVAARRGLAVKTPTQTLQPAVGIDDGETEAEAEADVSAAGGAPESFPTTSMTDQQQRDFVLALLAESPDMSTPDIRDQLVQRGGTLTPHQIAGLRRELRRREAGSTAVSVPSSDVVADDDDSDDSDD